MLKNNPILISPIQVEDEYNIEVFYLLKYSLNKLSTDKFIDQYVSNTRIKDSELVFEHSENNTAVLNNMLIVNLEGIFDILQKSGEEKALLLEFVKEVPEFEWFFNMSGNTFKDKAFDMFIDLRSETDVLDFVVNFNSKKEPIEYYINIHKPQFYFELQPFIRLFSFLKKIDGTQIAKVEVQTSKLMFHLKDNNTEEFEFYYHFEDFIPGY